MTEPLRGAGAQWLYQLTGDEKSLQSDLGACITAARDHFSEKNQRLIRAALETVNLLHPRGKQNERERYGLREVSSEDAELALHAAGFVIGEIGRVRRWVWALTGGQMV